MRGSLSLLALCIVGPGSAWSQELLHTAGNSVQANVRFAETVTVIDDVDQDGGLDIAIGEPGGGLGGASGVVRVYSGKTGLQLYSVQSIQPLGFLGVSIARLEDLNGDGIDEFAAGAFKAGPLVGPALTGKVVVVNGATGSALYEVYGSTTDENLGIAIASVGDVNGDGFGDFLASNANGVVYMISAADGSVLFTVSAPLDDWYGRALAGVGDVDQDGTPDFAVGAPSWTASAPGYVDIRSGLDGALIRQLVGESDNDRFGGSLSAIGDLTGDLLPELIVGAQYGDSAGQNFGTVYVYSPVDGSLLHKTNGASNNAEYGCSVSAVGDLTGDGIEDYAVGARNALLNAIQPSGGVWVHSGADASVVFVLAGGMGFEEFGAAVGGGDVNGDGVGDIAVGSTGADIYGIDGDLRVYSGTCSSGSGTFCVATVNTLGCTPSIDSNGFLSASGPDDFELIARDVLPNRPSMFFWGISPQPLAFSNGPFCVGNGLARTPVGLTLHTGAPETCPGTRSYLFQQSYAQGFGLMPGVTLFAQFWYRDPGQTFPTGAGLTEGLRFWYCP